MIDYNAVLAELEAQRDILDDIIAALRRVLAVNQAVVSYTGMSWPTAIVKCLEDSPQSAAQIALRLKAGGKETTAVKFTATVSTNLSRMRIAGEVVRVGNELWARRDMSGSAL